jgi:hypothetical protein
MTDPHEAVISRLVVLKCFPEQACTEELGTMDRSMAFQMTAGLDSSSAGALYGIAGMLCMVPFGAPDPAHHRSFSNGLHLSKYCQRVEDARQSYMLVDCVLTSQGNC